MVDQLIPFFSICTPVYNGSEYIDTYLRSVLDQSFCDFEVIIVDDGSTDASFELLSSLVYRDQRFNLLKPDICSKSFDLPGPWLARNLCLRKASGKYICFWDIDDIWHSDYLELLYTSIVSSKCPDIVFSTHLVSGQSLQKKYKKDRFDLFPVTTQLLFWNPFPMLATSFKSSIAKGIHFHPIPHEDYIFWFDLHRNQQISVSFNSSLSAIYRVSETSFSSNKFSAILWWLNCYRLIGHSYVLIPFFFFPKVVFSILGSIRHKFSKFI